jgi:serine/threonine-protein kinase
MQLMSKADSSTPSTTSFERPYSLSSDGAWLAFQRDGARTRADVWALPLQHADTDRPDAGKPIPILQTEFNEQAPMISPDGKWLAYQSDETGTDQIYVRPFPGPGGKFPVSAAGGSSPVWAKNSHDLFFRAPEGMMMTSYSVHGMSFESTPPRLWAAKRDLGQWFDIAPDGKRFIVVENDTPEDRGSTDVTFVLNFFDELRRVAPVKQ